MPASDSLHHIQNVRIFEKTIHPMSELRFYPTHMYIALLYVFTRDEWSQLLTEPLFCRYIRHLTSRITIYYQIIL